MATSGFLAALEYTKFFFSDRDSALGELTVLPQTASWFERGPYF